MSPEIESIPFASLKNPLKTYSSVDESAEKGVFVVPCDLPAKKIVFSGTGNLQNDWDDVTNFADAAKAGVKKAHSASNRQITY